MAASPFFRRIRTGIHPGALICALPAVVAFIVLLFPLFGLLADLVPALLAGSPDITAPLSISSRRLYLLLASIGLSAAVAGAGILIGFLFISALSTVPQRLIYATLIILLALAGIPPYIHALTWSEVFLLAGSGADGFFATGWLVSFWVELMALLPLCIFLAWIAFATVDIQLIDAARLARPDLSVLMRVILPLASPALKAAFGFLFLICCTDYSVPSLFGADVYALDIFAQFSASGSAAQALLYALPLLLVSFCVMLACRSGIRTLSQTPRRLAARFGNPPSFPRWFRLLQAGAATVIVVQVVVLFSGLLLAVGSPGAFIASVLMAKNEISYSLLTAMLVIVISLPLAYAVAHELKRPDLRGAAAWLIVLIPLAIPAPLVGIGLITAGNIPFLSALYPALIMPVIVAVIRFAPLAAIVLFVQLRLIDPILFDAAAVFGRSRKDVLTRIHLPLAAPGLIVSAGILAALTLAELGATLIVAPPGHATLTMRIYNYLHYGAAADVAGLCLMITLLTLITGSCTILAFRACSRHQDFIFREPGP